MSSKQAGLLQLATAVQAAHKLRRGQQQHPARRRTPSLPSLLKQQLLLPLQALPLQPQSIQGYAQEMRLSQAKPAPAHCLQHGHPLVVVGLAHEPTGPAAVAAAQDYQHLVL
jgi:hypothetical protein